MTTVIITISALAALALCIALIFKWKNAPKVEEERTKQQAQRQDFFTRWRENIGKRWRRKI